jgi:hypothetical protein
MDSQQPPQPGQVDQESVEQARARFWAKYLRFGQTDRAWFAQHVPSLLKIATQDYGPVQPWYMPVAITPPPPPPARHQRVREKILVVSLARLGGPREPVVIAR